MKSFLFHALFFLAASSNSYCQTAETEVHPHLVSNGAKPQLISKQFSFTEGPAVDKAGNIYFTDQPNNKIWKYSTDGKLSVFLSDTRRANGLYFDKKGNLISCADESNQIISINPAGKITVLVDDFEGYKLNGPNDLWVHPKGGVYFTDPYYKRDYWPANVQRVHGEKVYFLSANKKRVTVVDSSLKQPNGIVGTADGKYLFIADIAGNKTYKFSVNADGSLRDRQLFTDQGSDGMTIDNLGNIYLTGKGVTVYNKDGKKIDHFDIPEDWTSNVCFGGTHLNKLFITASKAVYVLNMLVKGVR